MRSSRLPDLIVIVATVATLAGCGSPETAPPPTGLGLRLGVATLLVPAIPNSVLWLAKDAGFYQREGLDVSLLQLDGTPRVIAAMLAGDLDIANVSTDQMLLLTASGRADLRAMHSPDPRQFFLVASRGPIDRVEKLRGKTFAISAIGGLDDTTTRLVLRAQGIAMSDMNLIALGDPSARAAALVAGRVDATTISIGTWSAISRSPGIQVLISPEKYFEAAPLVAKVDAVTAGTLAAKPEQLRRFTRALLKAIRFFAQSRAGWVDAIGQRRPDLDRLELSALWDRFRGSWAVDGGMDQAQLEATADILYSTAEFGGLRHLPVSRWTAISQLEAVLQQLGRVGEHGAGV